MLKLCHINTSKAHVWDLTALCMYRFKLKFEEGAIDNEVEG